MEKVNFVHSWCRAALFGIDWAPEQIMEVSATILCPFCGQRFDIVVDTSHGSQRLALDCEVCCRPLEVAVECEPGEILDLDVVPN